MGSNIATGRNTVTVLFLFCSILRVQAQAPISFIGIKDDEFANKADHQLQKYLEKHANVSFQRHLMPYGAAVQKLAEWDPRVPYLARVTPYVFVAAEMLGAKFDILATYKGRRTDATTYHSYMVVNRESWRAFKKKKEGDVSPEPQLSDLKDYLRHFDPPAKFIYHDRFSTSSYFLPSLYFKENHVAATTTRVGDTLMPIRLEKAPPGAGSSFLVNEVAAGRAEGRADLAAIWDGTINDLNQKKSEVRDRVLFIQLPTDLPNDFLVCRFPDDDAKTWDQTKERITAAIDLMQEFVQEWEVKESDFKSWVNIKDAPEVLEALADLRSKAAERPAPVTVDVRASQAKPVSSEYVEAAKQAIRLAGTEFVPYDAHFHQSIDVVWTLESIHDGAIVLRSEMPGFEDGAQQLPISFVKPQDFSTRIVEDLTKRIVEFIHSRMHRIRFIWLYQDRYPTVIRDFDFTPQPMVKVQRIDWMDPDRDGYEEDTPFTATILNPQAPDKLQLVGSQFPRGAGGTFEFEPMSNVGYRVLLKRQTHEQPLLHALTYALIVLLIAAAGALFFDLRRARPAPEGLHQTCQRMVEEYHRPWKTREILEGDVIWCDPEIEKFINELKVGSWLGDSNGLGGIKVPGPVPISLASLRQIFYRLGVIVKLVPPEPVDIDNMIKYLIGRERLAPFVGRPLEWDALEVIMTRSFQRLGIGQRAGDAHLQRDTPILSALVARHFQQVLREGQRDVSFFRQTWQVSAAAQDKYFLSHQEDLGSTLQHAPQEGPVSSVSLEFSIPVEPRVLERLNAANGDAWLLGKILSQKRSRNNGTGCLHLEFKPLVLVKSET